MKLVCCLFLSGVSLVCLCVLWGKSHQWNGSEIHNGLVHSIMCIRVDCYGPCVSFCCRSASLHLSDQVNEAII